MSTQTCLSIKTNARVCYVTKSTIHMHVTLEDPITKVAYRAVVPSILRDKIRIGMWINLIGVIRPTKIRGVEKEVPYYHDPFDGSERSKWKFYDVSNSGMRIQENLPFLSLITDTVEALNLVKEDLNSEEQLKVAVKSVERLSVILNHRLAEKIDEKAKLTSVPAIDV